MQTTHMPRVHTWKGLEHVPVVVSQVPTMWHWSEAVQTLGFPPKQVPSEHVSVRVQGLPSLQRTPLACGGKAGACR